MNFFVITRKSIMKVVVVALFIMAAFIWYSFQAKVIPAYNAVGSEKVREIYMVTSEFSTTLEDGSEMEVYRWDPGTIYLKAGEKVNLKIIGVNGKEHPFIIEGTDIQGTVKKGKETVIPLQFNEPGIYRLICISHQDPKTNGPMIADIVVDK